MPFKITLLFSRTGPGLSNYPLGGACLAFPRGVHYVWPGFRPAVKRQVATIQMRDRQTFDRVFTRFYAPLCQFATKYLAEPADAEDVVESLFLKLWKQHETFADADHARMALYRATYHACLNHLRGRNRLQRREERYAKEHSDVEDSYLPNLLKAELVALIHREIDKLPSHYAAVLKLSYRDGLKNEEIADQLQLSLQTVKNYKHKGISLLRDQLPKGIFLLFFASELFF